MNRTISLFGSILVAMGLSVSTSTWAQEPTITLGQVGRILTPTGMTHSKGVVFAFDSEFDGRTITLSSPLVLVRLDQKSEDATPPAFVDASCGPQRVMSMLHADKYLEPTLAKTLSEGKKDAPAIWMMGDEPVGLQSVLTTQGYSTAVIYFRAESTLKFLKALYEKSHVDLLLYEVDGKVLTAGERPIVRIQVNRQNAKSMSALAQTLSFCETMSAARK